MKYDCQLSFMLYIFIFNSYVQSFNIEPFLKPSMKNIVLCSDNFEDLDYEILMPKSNQYTLFSKWGCNTIPKIDNSLIILDDVQPGHVRRLLNPDQDGIQISLSSNIWLIHSKNQSLQIKEFFIQNELRIGLNAQIFIIRSLFSHDDIVQVLGTGTTKVEHKVRIF